MHILAPQPAAAPSPTPPAGQSRSPTEEAALEPVRGGGIIRFKPSVVDLAKATMTSAPPTTISITNSFKVGEKHANFSVKQVGFTQVSHCICPRSQEHLIRRTRLERSFLHFHHWRQSHHGRTASDRPAQVGRAVRVAVAINRTRRRGGPAPPAKAVQRNASRRRTGSGRGRGRGSWTPTRRDRLDIGCHFSYISKSQTVFHRQFYSEQRHQREGSVGFEAERRGGDKSAAQKEGGYHYSISKNDKSQITTVQSITFRIFIQLVLILSN